MFEEALKETAKNKRHMTAREAGRVASEAGGVKRMGLIHYSPRYTERDLKRLLSEARQEFPDVFLTRDRQQIEIPYNESGNGGDS
jgi:ribonuclease Z